MMITAREAYKATEKRLKHINDKAKAFALNEYEHYLEPAMLKAIEIGEWQANYYWSEDLFTDAEISQASFYSAIKTLLTELGYKVDSGYDADQLFIIWSWYDVEED